MIKSLFQKVFNKNMPADSDDSSSPQILPASQFNMSEKDLSRSALNVLDQLTDAGYESYLVGGGVRDVLLGKHPKDFDIATGAHPEQVKQVFPRCRLVGKRFRLAHVRHGRDIVEVATFRASHHQADKDHQAATSEEGMILRDNVYGTAREDAERRDFTVNALYYDHKNDTIIDYVQGLDDLRAKQLRLIGEPEERYREDPVRMLRAIRFAVKLGFQLEAETESPILQLNHMLSNIPPARLFEEVLKMFLSGHAQETFKELKNFGLMDHLFPQTLEAMRELPWFAAMVQQALINTDERLAQKKSVTPYFFYAVLLWGPTYLQRQRYMDQGVPAIPALIRASQDVIQNQLAYTSIPKRFAIPMKEIWELQQRLDKRFGKRAEQLRNHPRFRAAFDFLLLREQSGEIETGLGEWWQAYQDADDQQRREMVSQLQQQNPGKKGKRRRRRPANTNKPTTH